jgi:hypothetical protein
MSDMDDEVRRTLQQRADDVRPHREVPPGLGPRAGRRIALNSVVVGAVAVVLAAGVVVGVRAMGGPDDDRLGGSPSPRITHSQNGSTSKPQPCAAGRLRAVGALEGAAGSREGAIRFTNFGGLTCTVTGRPRITLMTSPGHPIRSGITCTPTDAAWMVNGESNPAGWPVVTLHPGATASVRIRWGNWCPQGRASPLWQARIPRHGAVAVSNGMDESPPCSGSGEPSMIEVGPFEPARS